MFKRSFSKKSEWKCYRRNRFQVAGSCGGNVNICRSRRIKSNRTIRVLNFEKHFWLLESHFCGLFRLLLCYEKPLLWHWIRRTIPIVWFDYKRSFWKCGSQSSGFSEVSMAKIKNSTAQLWAITWTFSVMIHMRAAMHQTKTLIQF